jgi:hypothetical protein
MGGKLTLPVFVNLWFHVRVDLRRRVGAARNDGEEMTIIDDLSFLPSILV